MICCGETPVSQHPRAAPYMQFSCIQAPTLHICSEARVRIRVHYPWFSQPFNGNAEESLPREPVTLALTAQDM